MQPELPWYQNWIKTHKNYRLNYIDENDTKIFNKIFADQIQQNIKKRSNIIIKLASFHKCKDGDICTNQ
jgi:hypothetical protein